MSQAELIRTIKAFKEEQKEMKDLVRSLLNKEDGGAGGRDKNDGGGRDRNKGKEKTKPNPDESDDEDDSPPFQMQPTEESTNRKIKRFFSKTNQEQVVSGVISK